MKFLFLFFLFITMSFAEDIDMDMDLESYDQDAPKTASEAPAKKNTKTIKMTKKEVIEMQKNAQEKANARAEEQATEERKLFDKLSKISSNQTDELKENVTNEMGDRVHTEEDKAFLIRERGTTGKFTLYSTDFYKERRTITRDFFYNGINCNGKNISPSLYWEFPPENTLTFAVIMKDEKSNFFHWGIYNMPDYMNKIEGNVSNETFSSLPFKAVVLPNDYGENNYGGPCITDGLKHTYKITIYAFDRVIEKVATPRLLDYIAEKRAIGKASITAIYDGKDRRAEIEERKKREREMERKRREELEKLQKELKEKQEKIKILKQKQAQAIEDEIKTEDEQEKIKRKIEELR